MLKKISSDFQWLLHLAVLSKIIKDHPDPKEYFKYLKEFAKELGERLIDDFCAKFIIYEQIKNKDLGNYIKMFLEFYFSGDLIYESLEIHFSNDFLNHQKNLVSFYSKEY